ncbi:MAG: hypothetical protein KKB09_07205 [Nanoarchaeota archaeon]|nr:hypothetical protein [Nanoarchaeota archaeon]
MSIIENQAMLIMEAEADLSEETATEEPLNDTKTVITMPENTTKKYKKTITFASKRRYTK